MPRRPGRFDAAEPDFGTPARPRPEPAKTRHRFAREGDVSVQTVTGPRSSDAAPSGQAAALRADLDAERAARAGIERSLAQAQTTIRSLQAKPAHTELAHADALAAERWAREQAEAALRDAVSAREGAERWLKEMTAQASVPAQAPRTPAKRAKAVKPTSKAPAAKTREPKPVKWWLPGDKASTKAP